jgi:ASC-1-like (ASCH) protein
MSRIEKKTWPEYFEKILNGSKTYDLRVNDFDIREGDTIVFKEWYPNTSSYTGREIVKKVGFVGNWKTEDLEKWWPKKDIEEKGLKIMSLLD